MMHTIHSTIPVPQNPLNNYKATIPINTFPKSYLTLPDYVHRYYCFVGFGVLMVNYRGSVGFGEASVSSLLGHVGDNDVSDVHQATQETLARFPLLDPEHCVLFGGSHGGFLVTHLSGQFPVSVALFSNI
jgi:acylaminoacyl-peptidase